jgi:hypothetical protein
VVNPLPIGRQPQPAQLHRNVRRMQVAVVGIMGQAGMRMQNFIHQTTQLSQFGGGVRLQAVTQIHMNTGQGQLHQRILSFWFNSLMLCRISAPANLTNHRKNLTIIKISSNPPCFINHPLKNLNQ